MKVQEHKIKNKKVIQIYISKQEQNDVDIQKQIEKIKEENSNIVVFVSGNNEPTKALKEMVKIMQSSVILNS